MGITAAVMLAVELYALIVLVAYLIYLELKENEVGEKIGTKTTLTLHESSS